MDSTVPHRRTISHLSRERSSVTKMPTTPAMPRSVADAFSRYPASIRERLLDLRSMILAVAAGDPAVGPLTETLKWGEPAYLTEQTRSGSTIRLGWKPAAPRSFAIYFNCRTTLVESFRARFSGQLAFEGNRAIVFQQSGRLPRAIVEICVREALTYHRRSGR